MKRKTRLLSIRAKILLSSIALFIVLIAMMSLGAIYSSEKNMVEMGVGQAKVAAELAAESVDTEALVALHPGDENSDNYSVVNMELQRIKEICGVAYLYTLTTDGSNVYYGVDTDASADKCMIGDEFEVSYAELKSVFAGEEYVQDYIDSTEDGDLISAYVPIKDASGKVIAVLGSDYDASGIVEKNNMMQTQMSQIGGICLVISLLLIAFIVTRITKSIKIVDSKLYDLVHNEGDLTQTLSIRTGDEMEVMADNVNSLLAYIREIMLKISHGSEELDKACAIISQNLNSAGESIFDVSSTMEEMSAAMEETSASLDQINDGIIEVYERIQGVASKAADGDNQTKGIRNRALNMHDQALEEQKNANALTKEVAESVNDKIEKSKAVERINVLTDNILSITSQTNLLALNANIEATRAGEAGKGFAVVAGEIGKLATDSAKAATEIQEVSAVVIDAVEELAAEAGRMIDFIENTAMEGYRKLLELSKDYYDDAENINQIMNQFAEDSEKLETIADNIKESIQAVNIAVEESARGVVSVTEVSTILSGNVREIEELAVSNEKVADDLAGEVGKFKLE